jgi:predicted nucleic acid-binding protein
MTVIADTGALYALADASDAWHERVLTWWGHNRTPIVVPVSIIPEVTYLLRARVGPVAEIAFVRAVTDGEFVTEDFESGDLHRVTELMERFIDLPLGFVDASIVALAERMATQLILTTDRRHFSSVQPRHVKRFTLLP